MAIAKDSKSVDMESEATDSKSADMEFEETAAENVSGNPSAEAGAASAGAEASGNPSAEAGAASAGAEAPVHDELGDTTASETCTEPVIVKIAERIVQDKFPIVTSADLTSEHDHKLSWVEQYARSGTAEMVERVPQCREGMLEI